MSSASGYEMTPDEHDDLLGSVDLARQAVSAAARLEGEVSRLRTELAACSEAYQAHQTVTPEEWVTLRRALAIGMVSWDGDSWFAADAGYGYREADATMSAAAAIIARVAPEVVG